jgi:ketosteroid isomerase-like protein
MKMQSIVKSIICALLLLGVQKLSVVAQTQKSASTEAVAAVVETLKVAMVNADSVKLSQIVSDHLSYGHSSGIVQDKKTFIHSLTSGASDFVAIELSNQTIEVSGSTAIVRHVLSGATNDGGKPGNVKINILLVWQKVKGQWLLLARQAFRVPAAS